LAICLSVSRDHTPRLCRHGDVLRGRTWFAREMLSEPYRSREPVNGVNHFGVEVPLDDIADVRIVDPRPGWAGRP
jgi:hypothetical protein